MKIIYNPTDGAPITSFVFKGVQIDTHYPDGFQTKEGVSKGLVQYDDEMANALCETYQFLQILDEEQAKERLSRQDETQFKCDFPDCDFKTNRHIALAGHKKTHEKDILEAKNPVVDPKLIPVATGRKVPTLADRQKMIDNNSKGSDIINGRDADGVEWYGDGVTVDNPADQKFGAVPKAGEGHFL